MRGVALTMISVHTISTVLLDLPIVRPHHLAMETAKKQVQQILENLPDDASLEEIQYQIYVRQKIEQGVADADAGRVVPQEEVQRRLAKWRTK